MTRSIVRADCTPTWPALRQHFDKYWRGFDLRDTFNADPARAERFSQRAPHVFADLSKNPLNASTEALLLQLAEETGVQERRRQLFAGARINTTEDRAVMHWLLRCPAHWTPPVSVGVEPAGRDPLPVEDLVAAHEGVHVVLEQMLAYAERVRANPQITDIVNIGIGGSDLGPQMVVRALQPFVLPGKRFHFVSNVDGHELARTLSGLSPDQTLFIVASKTFSTAETMRNARSAKQWFLASSGMRVADHFVALTTHVKAARDFGIDTCFGFWDWVGGRYSLWSTIGLPIALAIGAQNFRALLAGAHAMDEHFRTAPLAQNLPVRLALLDLWLRNFHGTRSRCIAPYHSDLSRLPAYLQQLEMESNGKRVDRSGAPLQESSCEVIWGEPGTNGQHAYFQMLHQGTEVIPVEFIVVRQPTHQLPGHHEALMANAIGQAQALLMGQPDAGGHRHFSGSRPSTFFLLDRLTPESLGAFLAMYEHRVFVSGALAGLNSFDQWGVELGKVLAREIESRLAAGDTRGLDASTARLVELCRATQTSSAAHSGAQA